MTTERPVSFESKVRRTVRAVVADFLAVFTLGVLVGFLWWSQ